LSGATSRPAALEDRRKVHAALAAVTDAATDPDHHAWHRAQAAAGPDEDVAAELVRSADRARARGGMAAAAAFLSRATQLTPDRERRLDRAIVAAEAHLSAGEPGAALDLLRYADPEALDPLRGAQVERLRGQVALAVQRGTDAPPLLRGAARLSEHLDVRTARDTHLDALFAAIIVGSSAQETDAAAAFARSAPPAPDPPEIADLLLDGIALILAGDRPAGTEQLKHALAQPPDEHLRSPPPIITFVCVELWDLDAWVAILSRQIDHAGADGALAALAALGPIATARGEATLLGYARFAEAILHNGLGDHAAALAIGRAAMSG
jgi:hypothetical protein